MTMPTFTDGAFMHQSYLNLLSNGLVNQSLLLTGVPPPRAYIPTATAKITTTHAVANRTDTQVIFDAAGVNNDVMFVAAQAAFVIKTGGVYVAWGQACWTANATGTRSCSILLNGAAPDGNGVALTAEGAPSGSDLATICCQTQPMALSPGAALYFNTWQSSGGSLNLNTGISGTYMAVMRLGNQT
jgi:hypothetical protein